MPEWLLEEGIGEHRAVRLEHGRIAEARVAWPDEIAAGLVVDAVLTTRASGSPRGAARLPGGEEVLVERLPATAREGAPIRLEVTRPPMIERGRGKMGRARPTEARPRAVPTLAESLVAQGHRVRTVRRFPEGDWDELLVEAFDGMVSFSGGHLLFCPTPAMLLVDIDGALTPRELALAAIPPLAESLRRFDVGGAVGIDFPSIPAKADRRAIDDTLEAALARWPHERTAMNGFGFVQIVARLERPSLLHRAAFQTAELAARHILRRAEGLEGAGTILLSGHPSLEKRLAPEWLSQLARRTGRDVRFEGRSTLAIGAPQAQLVPR